ncbi:hypothetical protein [Tissierella sp.]|uniref:hypothetical protein n=1 Tax=Tissierella sp. TaxID=41274 RepID=UPI003075277B
MKTTLKVKRIYKEENKLENLILEIIENELDTKFEELYNKTQTADTVINQNERLVA